MGMEKRCETTREGYGRPRAASGEVAGSMGAGPWAGSPRDLADGAVPPVLSPPGAAREEAQAEPGHGTLARTTADRASEEFERAGT